MSKVNAYSSCTPKCANLKIRLLSFCSAVTAPLMCWAGKSPLGGPWVPAVASLTSPLPPAAQGLSQYRCCLCKAKWATKDPGRGSRGDRAEWEEGGGR